MLVSAVCAEPVQGFFKLVEIVDVLSARASTFDYVLS
jgi:hypothetical protein